MLDFFSTFNVVQRQQRKLLHALAQWQRSPNRDLGEYGLSVTTEITNPSSAAITIQFSLHHEAGGILQSGLVSLGWDWEGNYLGTIESETTPLLREFLLPSAIASGEAWAEPKPLAVLEGGLSA